MTDENAQLLMWIDLDQIGANRCAVHPACSECHLPVKRHGFFRRRGGKRHNSNAEDAGTRRLFWGCAENCGEKKAREEKADPSPGLPATGRLGMTPCGVFWLSARHWRCLGILAYGFRRGEGEGAAPSPGRWDGTRCGQQDCRGGRSCR